MRCYQEGDGASSYRVGIEPGSAGGPNALVDQLRSTVDADRDPWASLAQAIQTTVGDRGRQLDERLRSDASTLNQLNRFHQGDDGSRKQAPAPG